MRSSIKVEEMEEGEGEKATIGLLSDAPLCEPPLSACTRRSLHGGPPKACGLCALATESWQGDFTQKAYDALSGSLPWAPLSMGTCAAR